MFIKKIKIVIYYMSCKYCKNPIDKTSTYKLCKEHKEEFTCKSCQVQYCSFIYLCKCHQKCFIRCHDQSTLTECHMCSTKFYPCQICEHYNCLKCHPCCLIECKIKMEM